MTLARLRKRIDRADRALIRALGQRFEAIEALAGIKEKLGLPIVQKARWKDVIADRMKLAKSAKLHPKMVERILTLIHAESVRVQRARRRAK
jgi:chorismate mutase